MKRSDNTRRRPSACARWLTAPTISAALLVAPIIATALLAASIISAALLVAPIISAALPFLVASPAAAASLQTLVVFNPAANQTPENLAIDRDGSVYISLAFASEGQGLS